MKCCSHFGMVCTGAVLVVAGTLAFAQTQPSQPQPPKPNAPRVTPPTRPTTPTTKPAAPADQDMHLPPGWTEADMQACMEAGMPGPNHEQLAKSVGVWMGKNTMWMGPGAEPMKSESTSTITTFMDGRFIKCEVSGDMPGMGPFSGFGIYGYDNVAQRFQATWIDNCGTGMMNGTGELSSDGKTMTWVYSYYCPITKRPTTMREVDRWTGKDTKTMEMYTIDPKSGKEYKMMEMALTRKPGTAAVSAPTGTTPGMR